MKKFFLFFFLLTTFYIGYAQEEDFDGDDHPTLFEALELLIQKASEPKEPIQAEANREKQELSTSESWMTQAPILSQEDESSQN